MLMGEYLTNYDEYLAHINFLKVTNLDRRFKFFQKRQNELFNNFEIIINSIKMLTAGNMNRMQFNPYRITYQLQAIAYDSLFFYVAEDNSFINWCKDKGLEELYNFINWQFEDFEHIRGLGLGHKETRDKVLASYFLSLNVNPIMLLIANKIEFVETAKRIHEEMIQNGRDTDLADLWEKRRLLHERS